MTSLRKNKNLSASFDPKPTVVAPPSGKRRSAHQALLFGLTQNKRALASIAGLIVIGLLLVGVVFFYTDLTWSGVTTWIDGVDPIAALPLMALLPVVGFPISVVYLFAGARFGPVGGGVVVTIVTAVHLLATYGIARSFLRGPLQRFIERKHLPLPHIPEDEQAAICVIAALVPGLPYVMRNYLLALAGVRFRYYFWVCLPIYVARSYVTILLGDMSSNFNLHKVMILVGVDVLKVGICAFVIWRLREHHRKYHGHEHEHGEHGSGPDALPPPNAAAK
jgi:uncharacterized membrane protein YdjX (TVP38/TMEM64 family)